MDKNERPFYLGLYFLLILASVLLGFSQATTSLNSKMIAGADQTSCPPCRTSSSLLAMKHHLCSEFKDSGVYLRKVRRLVDEDAHYRGELSFISEKKHNQGSEDFKSSCVVKSGRPILPFDRFPAPGFFISHQASLGIWGSVDLSTIPSEGNPSLRQKEVRAARVTKRKRTDSGEVELKTSWGEIESEINQIKTLTPHNEALIDYGLEDVLGVYVEVPRVKVAKDKKLEALSSYSVIRAANQTAAGWKKLKDAGKVFPLVEYHSDGSIQFVRSIGTYLKTVYESYCGVGHSFKLVEKIIGKFVESDMNESDCKKLSDLAQEYEGEAPLFDIQPKSMGCSCSCLSFP